MPSSDLFSEPFLDWFGVWPGASGYEPDGRAWISEAPRGVSLAVQPPVERADLGLTLDQPWEGGHLRVETILQEEGRLRIWYQVALPGEGTGVLCYAESHDGFHWTKPALGMVPFAGSTANNIVGAGLGGAIFRDTNPAAPAAERYKLLHMVGRWARRGQSIDEPQALRLRNELSAQGYSEAEINTEVGLEGEVVGAVSPDGLHWTAIETPLLRMFCDCDNVAYYDEETGHYVGYFRHNMFRESVPTLWPPNPWRCVGRSETTDFRRWPTPRIVLQPDGQDPPTLDIYTNAYTPYPGGRYHLMFPSIYHRLEDTVDIHLAVSRDGYNWLRPQKSAIIPLGGADAEGMLYAKHGLFPLDAGRWGLVYAGSSDRHNESYYYTPPPREDHYRWALWQPDRLVALEAPVAGQVTLLPRVCHGDRLLLNYQTEANGWLRVELVEPMLWPPERLQPLAGHSFAECEPLRGDSLTGEVRWNGSADLTQLQGRSLCLRVELVRAKLFALSI